MGVFWLQYFNGETVKKGGYWQFHRVGNLSEDNQKVPRENQVCFQCRFFLNKLTWPILAYILIKTNWGTKSSVIDWIYSIHPFCHHHFRLLNLSRKGVLSWIISHHINKPKTKKYLLKAYLIGKYFLRNKKTSVFRILNILML